MTLRFAGLVQGVDLRSAWVLNVTLAVLRGRDTSELGGEAGEKRCGVWMDENQCYQGRARGGGDGDNIGLDSSD